MSDATLHMASVWFLRARAQLEGNVDQWKDADPKGIRQNWRWAADDCQRLISCGFSDEVVTQLLLMMVRT